MTDLVATERVPAPVDLAGVLVGLREFRRLTYRGLVLQVMQTTLPPVWQAVDDDGTDLVALAATCGCAGPIQKRCPQWDLCLAAAVWLDCPQEWAAGIARADRVEFFAELERIAVAVDPWIAAQQPPDAA